MREAAHGQFHLPEEHVVAPWHGVTLGGRGLVCHGGWLHACVGAFSRRIGRCIKVSRYQGSGHFCAIPFNGNGAPPAITCCKQDTMDIDLLAVVAGLRASVLAMQRGGTIICVASAGGRCSLGLGFRHSFKFSVFLPGDGGISLFLFSERKPAVSTVILWLSHHPAGIRNFLVHGVIESGSGQ